MKFTDLFLRRPVMATVISLMIFLLGLMAFTKLNVRQYPAMQNAVITVTTVYTGADASLIQGFITTPLESAIASADGIDYLTSTSVASASSISAYLRLDSNPDAALTQVLAKVNQVRNQLPSSAEEPTITLSVGQTTSAMYLSFSSDILTNNQITDYLVRVVEPKLATVPGVQQAKVLGSTSFAMRIWMKPDKMAALGIAPADVYAALKANNVLSAVGGTKGTMVAVDLKANTDLQSVDDFKRMVVRAKGTAIVRLGDIAKVELGSESYSTSVRFNGQKATFMGVDVAPDANSLDVIKAVRDVLDTQVQPQLPEGLVMSIPYDSTEYIQDSIDEVIQTIIEAILIVILVIYLFLGNFRSVIIPAVTMPLSLVGALFLMWLMGFSINLLTLLSMVLAIGLVVDDAIIVLENVHRHIEEGKTPFDAAMQGARELAWPVVAMTSTLIAVFLPIGFLGGITGALFVEFAFSLAAAVFISGIIALTLTPMMTSKLLKAHDENHKVGKVEAFLDEKFDKLRHFYVRLLHGALNDRPVILVFCVIIIVSCYFLFVTSPKEMAPQEDQGFIISMSTADPYATLDYVEKYTQELTDIATKDPAVDNIFLLNGIGGGGMSTSSNTAIAGFVLKSWNERDKTTAQVQQELQQKVNGIAGLQVATFIPPSLPTSGGGMPVQFVIGTTDNYANLKTVGDEVLKRAYESKKFIFIVSNLKIDKPVETLIIDREKAATLGLTMAEIGQQLSAMMAGGYTGYFALDNRSYKVIPQVERSKRLTAEQLKSYYIRTSAGQMIPLSTLVTLKTTVEPEQLNHFQQLNSVTLQGVPRPGVTLGDALDTLKGIAKDVLPPGYSVDYGGESRQLESEGSDLIVVFFFALIVIYLVLSAQFESFRDPLIMLITVPMSICGAMIFVSLGVTTLNIYTEVGLVTLIGVISKHGILIVEFANKLQEAGMSKRRAIEEAASIRLRPILMTTAALVLAMFPLLLAAGPGAGARFAMGLVIATGMSIGTLFTLFVLPTIYTYIGRDHGNTGDTVPAGF